MLLLGIFSEGVFEERIDSVRFVFDCRPAFRCRAAQLGICSAWNVRLNDLFQVFIEAFIGV
jgi:hypothetical protein